MASPLPPPTDSALNRLLGKSPVMESLRAQLRHLAGFDAPGNAFAPTLLLLGETGTGKGLVARLAHDSGPRAAGPFMAVNCAAIPETMLEAELFGFEQGAFTDARRAKPGLFEAASGGTLFLDELDSLSLSLQSKLLTAIEAKQIRRLGAVNERSVDVKLIAATNAVLTEAVAAGHFRADLYHRLAVIVLALPPLRERGEDIVLLAEAFLQQYATAHHVPPKWFNAAAITWLQRYAWPGNVREINHVMERVTLLHTRDEVDAETLERLCLPLTMAPATLVTTPVEVETVPESPLSIEAEQIRQALAQTGGNVVRAARLLGISRDTLRYRMRRHAIELPRRVASEEPLGPAFSEEMPIPVVAAAPEVNTPPVSNPTVPVAPALPDHSAQSTEPLPMPDRAAAPGSDTPTRRETWEQKPVAVLALELTWPEIGGASLHYEPWTEMAQWEQAIIDKVQGFGGRLLQRTASLLTWVFGLPHTLEQLPQRAVHAALAIRYMVSSQQPLCPEIRLAAHLGAVLGDPQAADPMARLLAVGQTLALPVRLLGQAEPGEIVITPQVGRLVTGWIALEARALRLRTGGSSRLGGYAVVGVNPGRTLPAEQENLPRLPLVGREREMALVEAAMEQVKLRRGQVVSLVGPPGMGKSRLLVEIQQRLQEQGLLYAEGHCLSYASAMPYRPIVGVLRDYFGITASTDNAEVQRKVEQRLQAAGLEPDTTLPYILHLLGVSHPAERLAGLHADVLKTRTTDTLLQLLLGHSMQQPMVLAVENVHWIDPSSEALLSALVDRLAGTSLLLLVTYRPGYRLPWLDKSYLTQIALQPLNAEASQQVVQSVLGEAVLVPSVEQHILAKAEGNPFFLEELAHTAAEQEGRAPVLTIPDTIQAVLAARLDRLQAPDKALLQVAAVIGMDIPWSLLHSLSDLSEEVLRHSLAHLQAAEFLYEIRIMPERVYTFKHILTQEAAYQSLLQEQRRALHGRIIDSLTALTPHQSPDALTRLVQHALLGERWRIAAQSLQQVGTRALARSAYQEAATCFTQALEALQHLPEAERLDTTEQTIDILFGLRGACIQMGELDRALAALREAETLAQSLNDPNRLGRVSSYMARHCFLLGEHAVALAAGQRAVALADEFADTSLQVAGRMYLGQVYHALGEYPRVLDVLQQNVEALAGDLCYERFGLANLPVVTSRAFLTYSLAELGRFAEGQACGDEAIRLSEVADHANSLAIACLGVGRLALNQGNFPHAIVALSRALDLCRSAHIALLFPAVATALAYAYLLTDRLTDAVPLVEQVQETSPLPTPLSALVVVWLGEMILQIGPLEEAQRLAEQAYKLAVDRQERGNQAWALRLLGKVATHAGSLDRMRAQECYTQALALASELGMQPLQAQCHLGLGILYQRLGRRQAASQALTTAVDHFRSLAMPFWAAQAEAALAQMSRHG